MYELSPENVLLQAERFRILAQALERMPLKRRRLVLLNRFEGLSYAEIGEQFGMSAENVRKHIERTLAECLRALAWLTCTKKQQHGWRGSMGERLLRMSAPGSTTGSVAVPLMLLPTKKRFELGAILQRCAAASNTGRCSASRRCESGWSARCVRRAGQPSRSVRAAVAMVVWLGILARRVSFPAPADAGDDAGR